MISLTTFAFAILASSPTAATAAGTEPAIHLEERVEATAPGSAELRQIGTNRIWITKDRVRVERGSAVQIYDARIGQFVSIDERTKTWYSVPAEALHRSVMVPPASVAGMTVDEDGAPKVPAVAFRKAKSGAWEATEPDVQGARTTLWFEKKLDPELEWMDLQRVVRAVFVGDGSPLASWFDQAEKMEGWPVRIERVSPGRRMRTELTKSERTLVDSAIFAAPGAGYTRVSDPSGFTRAAPAPRSRR